MRYWCWERDDWASWQVDHLRGDPAHEQALRALVRISTLSELLSEADHRTLEAKLLEEESINTSLIEGNILNRDSVKASIAKKVGIGQVVQVETREVDGLIETLTDATQNYDQPLTHERLFRWQASLFPNGRNEIGHKIITGAYRERPMEVSSSSVYGRKPTLHFLAPPPERVVPEMERFVTWFNQTVNHPGLIRAAIATYHFLSIHPFEDGNGRVGRAIADLAIAQSEKSRYRLSSLSETIKAVAEMNAQYYALLEGCQRGERAIDEWVVFFLNAISESAQRAEQSIQGVLTKTVFWDNCRRIALNERQKLYLNTVLDEGLGFKGHIKRQRYARVTAKIAGKISDATAKRDLLDLKNKGILISVATTGRNAGYQINPALLKRASSNK